jgi:glutaredoxin
MKKLTWSVWLLVGVMSVWWTFGTSAPVLAQPVATESDEAVVYVFGRDDCGFCKEQFAWLDREGIPYVYLNVIEDERADELFGAIAEKHDTTKATPLTIIGERALLGFDSPNTTGVAIKDAIAAAANTDVRTPEEHLERAPAQQIIIGGGCTGVACEQGVGMTYVFDLPLVGVVDLKSLSLLTLSAVLGVIDGFNPCAMWVLITFLVLLSQAGSRKKMIFLAGLFILAQGIMYNLILNVWYKTWDFVALDQYVTPLVGFLALGGATFFLWRWYKNRDAALVCDISDITSQQRTVDRFKKVVNQPVTIASVFAILAVAFSVNVIEFACSIGIPQAYTKILELNALTFLERQWYIFVFTLGYMLDDVIVFGLAIWGYSKLQAHGQKYAQLSLLVGGLLMLVLGLILVLNPTLLVL